MRAAFLTVLFLFCISPVNTLVAKEWVSSELLLDYPPIYFEAGGEVTGLYSDLQNEILREAGISYRAEYLSTKRSFREFWRARIQLFCCSNAAWWVNYDATMVGPQRLFSDPVIVARDIWVFPLGRPFDPYTELEGKRVGLVRGFGYRDLDEQNFIRVDQDSSEALIGSLLRGEVQAIVLNEFVYGWAQNEHKWALESGPVQDEVELSLMVHPTARALIPQINQAIERIQRRGVITRLVRTYIPSYQPLLPD